MNEINTIEKTNTSEKTNDIISSEEKKVFSDEIQSSESNNTDVNQLETEILEVDDIRDVNKTELYHNQIIRDKRTGLNFQITRYTNHKGKEVIRRNPLKPSGKQAKGRHEGDDNYYPELCQKIVEHFTLTQQDMTTDPQGRTIPKEFPTFEKFCVVNETNIETLHQYIKKYPLFADAYTRAKYLQKNILMKHGLSGAYNPIFTKFVAVNITDMRDKQEVIEKKKYFPQKSREKVNTLLEKLEKLRQAS